MDGQEVGEVEGADSGCLSRAAVPVEDGPQPLRVGVGFSLGVAHRQDKIIAWVFGQNVVDCRNGKGAIGSRDDDPPWDC